jgi:hypothetical protein
MKQKKEWLENQPGQATESREATAAGEITQSRETFPDPISNVFEAKSKTLISAEDYIKVNVARPQKRR